MRTAESGHGPPRGRISLCSYVHVGVDEHGCPMFRPREWLSWSDERRAEYDRCGRLMDYATRVQGNGEDPDGVLELDALRQWDSYEVRWQHDRGLQAQSEGIPSRRTRGRCESRPSARRTSPSSSSSTSPDPDEPEPARRRPSLPPALWVDLALILAGARAGA